MKTLMSVNLPFSSIEFSEAWSDWIEYKKGEFGFKFKTPQSQKASLKKLKRISGGDEQVAIATLEEAMSNGYRGFFKLSDKQISQIKVNDPKVISISKLNKYG